jgi:hypothetical protein
MLSVVVAALLCHGKSCAVEIVMKGLIRFDWPLMVGRGYRVVATMVYTY